MIGQDHPQSDEPGWGHSLPLIYSLVYCSRAVPGIDDAAVAGIIASSQRNNPRRGITGLLVFGSGIFFQWLEGPRENVLALMDAIRKDARHESVVPLDESEEARDRLFPDWDMELVEAGDIRAVLEDALESSEDENRSATLRQLLEQLESGQLRELGEA
jgi:flagellar motor component MotA